MLGYSHPMKNTNLPSWFYKEREGERMIRNLRRARHSDVECDRWTVQISHHILTNKKEIIIMSKIYTSSADQLIGKTPLLELAHIEKRPGPQGEDPRQARILQPRRLR